MNIIRAVILTATIALTGCASTHAKNPVDPLEPLNRSVDRFNEAVDKAVIKPVAKGYSYVVPAPIKMMVGNFFSNLDDVVVTANDLLQFKLVQGLSDGTRFVVNSTIGFYGLVDVGSMVGLEKHNEDFGQTLGKWGVGNGPYLVLPILGPSTLRDSVGLYVDSRPSKLRRVTHMRTRNQLYVLKAANARSRLLEGEKVLDEAVIDRYEFVRDAYLMRRKSLVYDGNPPREKYDEDLDLEEIDKAPIHNVPSSQQEVTPATQSAAAGAAPPAGEALPPTNTAQPVSEAAPPAGDTAQPSANAAQAMAATPQNATEAPGVHKVWVPQETGIN